MIFISNFVLRNYEFEIYCQCVYRRDTLAKHSLQQVHFAYSYSINMVTRTTFESNKTRERLLQF